MKNFLVKKTQHYLEYAGFVYRELIKTAMGIKLAVPALNVELVAMRKELADWQQLEDYDALTSSSIVYTTWLPVTYYNDPLAEAGGGGYATSNTENTATNLKVNYNYNGTTELNIIEINTGGGLTRINLNPTINVTGDGAVHGFVYHQIELSSEWLVTHNLGHIPNVLIHNSTGHEIEGLIEVISVNAIKIKFSEPVNGYAYLS